MTTELGVVVSGGKTKFAVRSPKATALNLCLFDETGETLRPMQRIGEDWVIELSDNLTGARYGFRADGLWDPDRGHWFDPSKLLVDPYAKELDRRFVQHPDLAKFGVDTAEIVPRAIVQGTVVDIAKAAPFYQRGGLIYEINVRAFTMLHPEVPVELRGTVAALAHPAVVRYLHKIRVSAVELMPVTAWIDERHLPPLGLVNSWGYNPVAPMALDPGLCPGGVAELRETVAALHEAGIGVFLDLVLNHTGESDRYGGILSLRGLDNDVYAHRSDGSLVNVTGTGNTLDFVKPAVRRLALVALRHFVRTCGIDGFRFDLATVLARGPEFQADAPIFAEIGEDPLLADRIMIAEPWDIGEGGYRVGQFPSNWLEWNDRFRDDVRRFWRGDREVGIGALATRIAGSSDMFGTSTRTVNYLASHDGMTLADVTSFQHRHNDANGENNRDGHHENFSWNRGVEGLSTDSVVDAERERDIKAMLATLFASFGSIMLTAGDEFGRSQGGNNNAYCQDNSLTWLDWENRDRTLEDYVALLASGRSGALELFADLPDNAQWLDAGGLQLGVEQWENPAVFAFQLRTSRDVASLVFRFDRRTREVTVEIRRDDQLD